MKLNQMSFLDEIVIVK